MSRYRLFPTPAQEAVLRGHCAHARYVWNLAVEQHSHWYPGRTSAPGYLEQSRQLTAARAEHPWLAAGSQMVQQQALRDFAQALVAFFDPKNPAGDHRGARPDGMRGSASWDGAGDNGTCAGLAGSRRSLDTEGRMGAVSLVPGRAARGEVLSGDDGPGGTLACRFRRDSRPVPGPGDGEVVGIDRGVAVCAALSTG